MHEKGRLKMTWFAAKLPARQGLEVIVPIVLEGR